MDQDLERGARIGRYEIRSLIGKGGMGAVYRAVDTAVPGQKRIVAIKTLSASVDSSSMGDNIRRRFSAEAAVCASLDHPNIVKVYDFGVPEGGRPYIVMECLRGQDLGRLLASGPLPITQAVDIIQAVCSAVMWCHTQGVLHRDLKPGNVFIAETPVGAVPKILDFGVSKTPLNSEVTGAGILIGTPRYMAPEQLSGEPATSASDQYAIGVLLYLCLTGRPLYDGLEDLALLQAIGRGQFTPPRQIRPEIPPELEAICLRALSLRPEDRWPSVHHLGRELLPYDSAQGRAVWSDHFTAPAPTAIDPGMSLRLDARRRETAMQSLDRSTVPRRPRHPATQEPGETRVEKPHAASNETSDPKTQIDAPSSVLRRWGVPQERSDFFSISDEDLEIVDGTESHPPAPPSPITAAGDSPPEVVSSPIVSLDGVATDRRFRGRAISVVFASLAVLAALLVAGAVVVRRQTPARDIVARPDMSPASLPQRPSADAGTVAAADTSNRGPQLGPALPSEPEPPPVLVAEPAPPSASAAASPSEDVPSKARQKRRRATVRANRTEVGPDGIPIVD